MAGSLPAIVPYQVADAAGRLKYQEAKLNEVTPRMDMRGASVPVTRCLA